MDGIKVSLLTFETKPRETWTAEQIENERSKLAGEGIDWHFLTYHKTPSAPATVYDVLCGAYFIWKMMRRERIDVLHARVHVPAMMGAIARRLSRRRPKLLFDIRGFFPEEYTDAGRWKDNGWLYHSVKKTEKWLLKESDGFVVLTEKAREILFPESKETGFDNKNRPVEVIPCCVDLKKFDIDFENSRREMRKKLGIENRRVIVYVGSFGGFYMTEQTADFYRVAKERNPETFALILTQSNPQIIKPLLEKGGYSEKDFFIQKVKPTEIPHYLSAADFALSFIKPSYSKLASSPTKNAEYLACGLPMITNSSVGDTTEFTCEDNVGFVIDEFNTESYRKALAEIEHLLEEEIELTLRCKQSAKKRFDLETVGGKRYLNIYRKLLNER